MQLGLFDGLVEDEVGICNTALNKRNSERTFADADKSI
jgi:hypothetical protein